MYLILFRVLLKLQNWMHRMALIHPEVIRSSLGNDGLLRWLQALDGPEAARLMASAGASMGIGCRINQGLILFNAGEDLKHLHLGERCHLGVNVFLDLAGPIELGDRVTVSMRTMIITHVSVGDSRCGIPPSVAGVRIDDDAYLGAGCMVLPGVTIGSRAVVAAGSLVTRSVAPGSIVAGVPAKPIRSQGASGTTPEDS